MSRCHYINTFLRLARPALEFLALAIDEEKQQQLHLRPRLLSRDSSVPRDP